MTLEITEEELHAFGGIDRIIAENEITDLSKYDAVIKGSVTMYDYVVFLSRLESMKTRFNSITLPPEMEEIQRELSSCIVDSKKQTLVQNVVISESSHTIMYRFPLPEDFMAHYKKICAFWKKVQNDFEEKYNCENGEYEEAILETVRLEKGIFCNEESFDKKPLLTLLRKECGAPEFFTMSDKRCSKTPIELEQFTMPLIFDTENQNIYDKYLFVNKRRNGTEIIYLPYGLFLFFKDSEPTSKKIKAFLYEWKQHKEKYLVGLKDIVAECEKENQEIKEKLKMLDKIHDKTAVFVDSEYNRLNKTAEAFARELETDDICAQGLSSNSGKASITMWSKNDNAYHKNKIVTELNIYQLTTNKEASLQALRSYIPLLIK